jgi:hypothetical protein
MVIFIYMDNKLETRQDKVNFIVGIFKLYQPTLNIPEQIALLTLWETSCVLAEEYEMASDINKEMKKIQRDPSRVAQKELFSLSNIEELKQSPLFIIENKDFIFKKNNKKSFFKKIFYWFKNLFKRS